jgi:hypothetical protein
MKNVLFISAFLISSLLHAQNNALILQDAAHVNIDAGAVLIVAQTSPSGIITQGTNTGVINSEGETNRVAWIINNGTGSYVIPFGINSTTRFPMTYQVTAAGSASGALTASTYPTPWTNLPHPSVYAPAVTNTGAQYIGGVYEERRQFTLDRFWVLRDIGMAWATKPTSVLTFTYRDIEHTAAGNTITEANLGAQYWETNQWRPGWFTGLAPLGAVNTVANTVSGVNSTTLGNLYTWVLVDNSNPLPVELLYFGITCVDDGVLIEWATASETNNDYFSLCRSEDGAYWQPIGHISGAGFSNEPLYYSFKDENGRDKNYIYRLTQTDYDGSKDLLGVKDANCSPYGSDNISGLNANIYSDFDNNIYITFYSSIEETSIAAIYDMNGKLIGNWEIEAVEGVNHFRIPITPVSNAIYMVSLQQSLITTSKKVLLK